MQQSAIDVRRAGDGRGGLVTTVGLLTRCGRGRCGRASGIIKDIECAILPVDSAQAARCRADGGAGALGEDGVQPRLA
eukprot:scaffold33547_cov129-Isochrysis_galbana.AAC.2